MGVWQRMVAAYIAARRAWSDPTAAFVEESSTTVGIRQNLYLERWSYANLSAYDDLNAWAARFENSNLYTKTRGIYNPVGRLCEFYESLVWPGTIAQGDGSLPPGARDALPFGSSIDPDLRLAILQVAQWTNLQIQLGQIAYHAAALGDCGLEIVDDVERGKVGFKLLWPGLVTELELDNYANARRVVLEYRASEDRKSSYVYRCEYTPETIRTYRDGALHSYGEVEADRDNPYGFVPFCWFRHRSMLGSFGEPAMRSWVKLDGLNSLASRTADYIATREKSPIGVAGEWEGGGIGDIDVKARRTDDSPAGEFGESVVGGEDGDDVFLLALPADAREVMLSGNLEPAQALDFIRDQLKELEADYPELTAFTRMREMSTASGIAIARAVRDAQGKLDKVQASHDQQLVKALQMAVAIGGWRYNQGDPNWVRTPARDKFAPFGLESYQNGDLDCALQLRPIEPVSEMEQHQARQIKYAAISGGKAAGLPDRMIYLEAGYSETEVDEILEEIDEAEVRGLQKALEMRRRAMPLELGPGEEEEEPAEDEDVLDAESEG